MRKLHLGLQIKVFVKRGQGFREEGPILHSIINVTNNNGSRDRAYSCRRYS
jgi:hypothetical protein